MTTGTLTNFHAPIDSTVGTGYELLVLFVTGAACKFWR